MLAPSTLSDTNWSAIFKHNCAFAWTAYSEITYPATFLAPTTSAATACSEIVANLVATRDLD